MASPTQRTPQPRSSDPEERDEVWLRARRERRLRKSLGAVLVIVAFAAVAIALSKGRGGAPPKPGSPTAIHDAAAVAALLPGIPESGTTLGSPHAAVTVTEFADLECSVCRDFAHGAEQQLIEQEVKSGRVKLVYRSLCTVTCTGPLGRAGFAPQQAAAYAAGLQGRAWYYIELFYREQGAEGTGYVSAYYLNGLARQIPGLDYRKWQTDSQLPRVRAQVSADQRSAARLGFGTTPTTVVQGPRGKATPIVGEPSFAQLQAAIRSVS